MSTKRKKAKPLEPEHIEATALEVIEARGLAAFSMRTLAAELGCEAMSLYHYYPSKQHLMNALLDRVISEIDIPEKGSLRQRMTHIARSWRAAGRRYPNFALVLITHRLNTPKALAFLERLVRVFTDGIADNEKAARTFRAFGYYVCGAVLDETAGYAKGPGATEPLSLEEQAAIAPTVVKRLSPYFKPEHWEATFMHGLDILIDAATE